MSLFDSIKNFAPTNVERREMRAGFIVQRVTIELGQALFLLRRSRMYLGRQIAPLGEAGDWRGLTAVNGELVRIVDCLFKIHKSRQQLPKNVTIELAPSTIESTNLAENPSIPSENSAESSACKADGTDQLEHE